MRALALITFIAACAPAPAERLRTPKPRTKPTSDESTQTVPEQRVAAKPRERLMLHLDVPDISIDITIVDPDPTPEIRWPLGLNDHPDLAPRYDIAKVMAEPGVDWIELCKMGAQNRTIPKLRDQLIYLRAWCAVGTREYGKAIESLARLRSTVVPGLAAAIRADLSNVLFSHDPNSARALVKTYGLSSEMDVLDRLAATYADLDKISGAIEINELALANDSGVSPSKTCQRLARRVLLDPETFRRSKTAFSAGAIRGFDDDATALLFGAKLDADPQCRELDAELSCWLVKGNCAAWYRLRGLKDTDSFLLAVKNAWPTDHRLEPEAWMNVVTPALNARPDPLGYKLAVQALENSLALTYCRDTRELGNIDWFSTELVSDKRLPADLKPRVERLLHERDKFCLKGD